MKTQFEKVLLSVNYEGYENEKNQLLEDCESFNLEIGLVTRITRISDFDKDQKLQIKENAFEFLTQYIEGIKPFKNSGLEFNLEAVGMMELLPVLKRWKTTSLQWQSLPFILNKNNRFEVDKNVYKTILNRYKTYTQTPEQNQRLELAKELEKLMNEAVSLNMISIYNRGAIAKLIQGLKIDATPDGKGYQFTVNTKAI
jgi:hypothetical protein